MITVKFDVAPLMRKLKRVQPLTGKPLKELIDQQAKLFIDSPKDGVLANTPPSGASGRGNEAKKIGESAVDRDIKKVYWDAPRIFEILKQENLNAAKGFYIRMLQGDYVEAQRIITSAGGRLRNVKIGQFNPSLHKQSRNRRGRVSRHVPAQIVTDFKKLDAFVKRKKKNVGILASGWNKAGGRLRARIPSWVKRHGDKFSNVEFKETETSYTVIMMPSVGFDANGTVKRAEAALKYRMAAIERRLPYLIKAAAKKAMA